VDRSRNLDDRLTKPAQDLHLQVGPHRERLLHIGEQAAQLEIDPDIAEAHEIDRRRRDGQDLRMVRAVCSPSQSGPAQFELLIAPLNATQDFGGGQADMDAQYPPLMTLSSPSPRGAYIVAINLRFVLKLQQIPTLARTAPQCSKHAKSA
jgi:hypothetical protein